MRKQLTTCLANRLANSALLMHLVIVNNAKTE